MLLAALIDRGLLSCQFGRGIRSWRDGHRYGRNPSLTDGDAACVHAGQSAIYGYSQRGLHRQAARHQNNAPPRTCVRSAEALHSRAPDNSILLSEGYEALQPLGWSVGCELPLIDATKQINAASPSNW